eukprot:4710171-Prymnesium_polylepis.2
MVVGWMLVRDVPLVQCGRRGGGRRTQARPSTPPLPCRSWTPPIGLGARMRPPRYRDPQELGGDFRPERIAIT